MDSYTIQINGEDRHGWWVRVLSGTRVIHRSEGVRTVRMALEEGRAAIVRDRPSPAAKAGLNQDWLAE